MTMTLSAFPAQLGSWSLLLTFVEFLVQRDQKEKKEIEEDMDEEDGKETLGCQG